LTAAGNVDPLDSARCRTPSGFGRDDVWVAASALADFDMDDDLITNDVAAGDFEQLEPADRSLTWMADAIADWGGQLKDAAHDVQPLKLPVLNPPSAQEGRSADGTATANTTTMRFLVDPVLVTDDASIRAQKLALKADLRIINGVWYLRNPANPVTMGTPIWSDHPGVHSTPAQEGVQLAGAAVGQSTLFGASARPQRYSYYSTDSGGQLSYAAGTRAVVSYGTLFRDGTGAYPIWRPGMRCDDGAVVDATTTLAACTATPAAATSEQRLLHGTRSGFRDAIAEYGSGGPFSNSASHTANVLPLNFDVGALQDALADTGAFELGKVLSDAGHTFNGIVYIAATWPGSMASPPLANLQGANDNDATQPANTAHAQRELPYPLCAAGAVALAGPFQHPDCDDYWAGPGLRAQINAVRIINARNIDVDGSTDPAYPDTAGFPAIAGGELPRGLTVVTHLPLYVLGDVNMSSHVKVTNPADAGYRWRPVLLAGDVVSLQSNAWSDASSRWHETVDCRVAGGTGTCAALPTWPRTASRTNVHAQLIGGLAMTTPAALDNAGAVYSGGLELFLRPLEDWPGGQPLVFKGGMLVTHLPVFAVDEPRMVDGIASRPVVDSDFDLHFTDPRNAAPGAPLFDVSVVRQWNRR
jgi:hypothetical protein